MKLQIIFYLNIFIYASTLYSQDTLHLTLQDLFIQAVEHAIDLKIAQSETAEQEYAFENARLAFQPQLFLDATLPNLNRSIEARPLPDGSDAFVNRSTMYNGVGVDLSYNVERTGGTFSLSSQFERLDIFKTREFDYNRTYFINPISISYNQPLFTFNELQWQQQRLSLLYAEFKERYARKREDVILQAIDLFRSCYLAQEKVALAVKQITETDSLKVIKDRLFAIGQSSRAEILRLELNQKNNTLALNSEDLSWQQAQMDLADFAGLDRNINLLLSIPSSFEQIDITWHDAMTHALNNNYITSQFHRRSAEALSNLARAEKDKDIQFNLRVSLGLNASAETLNNILNPLLDREIFNAGLRMPITGWRRYELREKMASEQIKQEDLSQELEKQNLTRTAFELVTNYELLKQSLQTTADTRNTATEILEITQQQFLQGQASYTDILVAGQEREQALLKYYETLLDIISNYYEIRRLCMYDFENDKPLMGAQSF